jgi:Flp pilus assembly protein TadD
MNTFKSAIMIFILHISFSAMAQSVESLMGNGQELLQRGAFSQAVTAFKQALSMEPDLFEAQFNLGYAYLQWGNNAQAVTEIKKALKLRSKSSEAWSALAIAYDNLNRNREALDALAQSVNCDPENLTARMNLAAMYANANRTQEAIAQYRQVVKVDTANSEALLNLAKSLIIAGAATEAKGFLERAMTAAPSKGEPHSDLGDIYWKKENNVDKGIAEYRVALTLEPANPAFYQSLAMALENKGQKKEAIDVWKKSLVYIDDALNKEKVQDRIDRLEKGSSAPPPTSNFSKEQTKDLERELRPETPRKETKRIDTKPVNVSSDFEDVNADSSGWDLAKEAKKRAQDRKAGETK